VAPPRISTNPSVQPDKEEENKEYDDFELDMPVEEEYSPDELIHQMELAAEQLIERFHMSADLSEDYRRRVHPIKVGADVRAAV